MISSIHFKNFKALEDFTIYIKDFNVLTGPNNNGKSTIIDGIRVLQGAYRYASRFKPKFLNLPFDNDSFGYEIPEVSIPIILQNIQTNFNTDDPSLIKYKLKDGKSITVAFHKDYPIYLYFNTPGKTPKTAKEFREVFPLNISIVPTLGPFEIEEELLDEDYVNRWYGSRRSARMFRSFWYHNPQNFQEFKHLVETTWKGMSISAPERANYFTKDLVMFCLENRMPREICWAGFGFQVWLQLLTHIVNSKEADLLVVDEPEIYLHPDLQHKILNILQEVKANVVVATHSVELINSIEPSDVLIIDKKNKNSKRISDLQGLQGVSNLLGSAQNIQLTRLARGKKILFVEGKDIKLLSRLAKVYEKEGLFTSGEITVISIDGFSQHDKIIHSNWAFSQVLGEELKISVLLDRDYRASEEIKMVEEKLNSEVELCHILRRKEIENYFLIPAVLKKLIFKKIGERCKELETLETFEFDTEKILFQVTELMKTATLAQIIAHKLRIKTYKDPSTIISDATCEFEDNWKSLEFRFKAISGKSFLSLLNDYLQKEFKVAITIHQIANGIDRSSLDDDIKEFFDKLDAFVKIRKEQLA